MDLPLNNDRTQILENPQILGAHTRHSLDATYNRYTIYPLAIQKPFRIQIFLLCSLITFQSPCMFHSIIIAGDTFFSQCLYLKNYHTVIAVKTTRLFSIPDAVSSLGLKVTSLMNSLHSILSSYLCLEIDLVAPK